MFRPLSPSPPVSFHLGLLSLQLCFEGQCRNASFLRAGECSAKCHGHGVRTGRGGGGRERERRCWKQEVLLGKMKMSWDCQTAKRAREYPVSQELLRYDALRQPSALKSETSLPPECRAECIQYFPRMHPAVVQRPRWMTGATAGSQANCRSTPSIVTLSLEK